MPSGHQELFAPLSIRHLRLKNRVVVPPMVQVRPITSAEGLAWYRRLAAGGSGLVIVQATSIAAFGSDLTAQTLKPLSEVIHQAGAAAAVQLFLPSAGDKQEPGVFSPRELEGGIEQFALAAEICCQAGFDGVEPHGAHGYLLNQFFMPDRNGRADEYGGSPDNRCRLGVRIVEAIRRRVGPRPLIFYRHTPVGKAYTIEDSLLFARRLVEAGLDVLDISPAKDKVAGDLAAPFKTDLQVLVIAAAGMDDPDAAADAIRCGRCDLVAIGRQLIADARWPAKVEQGKLADIVPCTKCSKGCFRNLGAGKPVECVLWPAGELDAYRE